MRCSAAGNAGVLQQPDGAPARLGGADRQVRLDRLDQLPADRVERIERGQRILEDRADLAAADLAHLLVRQVVDAPAVERISPPAMRPGGSSRPMIAAPVSDLPAPDSPTTPRISPGAIVERDVVERDQRAAARRELDPEVPDFEQRRRSSVVSWRGSARRAAAHRLLIVDAHREVGGERVRPSLRRGSSACTGAIVRGRRSRSLAAVPPGPARDLGGPWHERSRAGRDRRATGRGSAGSLPSTRTIVHRIGVDRRAGSSACR